MNGLRKLQAKFPGTCKGCGGEILTGSPIRWSKETGAFHDGCSPSGNPSADREYLQGRMEGNRRSAERKIYGNAFVEQMDVEQDLREAFF